MPGVGPVTAIALDAVAPPPETFAGGRDAFGGQTVPRAFCRSTPAWLGLVPGQPSTGGKTRLGRPSKMGQQDTRRPPLTGAMTEVGGAACCPRPDRPRGLAKACCDAENGRRDRARRQDGTRPMAMTIRNEPSRHLAAARAAGRGKRRERAAPGRRGKRSPDRDWDRHPRASSSVHR